MITTLLFLLLSTEPKASAPAVPTVSNEEQITLLKVQLDEVANKLAAAEATIKRMNTVNKLADEWNKRGCLIESDPQTGLVRCKATDVKDKK